MLVDGVDVMLIDLIGLGGFDGHYHTTDKILDQYYLSIEVIVAWGWQNGWARWPAVILFAYRLVGFGLFELTGARILLFIFPNLFELWWLYVVAVMRFRPAWRPRSWGTMLVPLGILLVPKMGQEYVLHFAEASPWTWFKEHVFDISR